MTCVVVSKLPEILEKRNITWAKFIEMSSLTARTVSKLCYNIEVCRLVTLEKAATALGIRVKDLFDQEDESSFDPVPVRRRGPLPPGGIRPSQRRPSRRKVAPCDPEPQ